MVLEHGATWQTEDPKFLTEIAAVGGAGRGEGHVPQDSARHDPDAVPLKPVAYWADQPRIQPAQRLGGRLAGIGRRNARFLDRAPQLLRAERQRYDLE